LIIKFFNRVNIFFGRVRYSAEDINEAIHEGAAGMIMTTLIHLRKVKPEIYIYVVALSLNLG